jgi:hypothetical protein
MLRNHLEGIQQSEAEAHQGDVEWNTGKRRKTEQHSQDPQRKQALIKTEDRLSRNLDDEDFQK